MSTKILKIYITHIILVSIYEECIRKSTVSKLTSIILKIIRDVFENIYNFVEESFAKQNLLTIMKI